MFCPECLETNECGCRDCVEKDPENKNLQIVDEKYGYVSCPHCKHTVTLEHWFWIENVQSTEN